MLYHSFFNPKVFKWSLIIPNFFHTFVCMKRFFSLFKTVVAVILFATTLVGNRTHAKVVVQHPHEALQADTTGFTKVFLAGTIDMGNSIDWQSQLAEQFESFAGDFLLYNPRQDHWNPDAPDAMDYQVNWELEHLESADFIIMNILGSSQSPITLLEMGLFARSGKLVVVCEPSFYRYDNVRITCAKYDVPLYSSCQQMIVEHPFFSRDSH